MIGTFLFTALMVPESTPSQIIILDHHRDFPESHLHLPWHPYRLLHQALRHYFRFWFSDARMRAIDLRRVIIEPFASADRTCIAC